LILVTRNLIVAGGPGAGPPLGLCPSPPGRYKVATYTLVLARGPALVISLPAASNSSHRAANAALTLLCPPVLPLPTPPPAPLSPAPWPPPPSASWVLASSCRRPPPYTTCTPPRPPAPPQPFLRRISSTCAGFKMHHMPYASHAVYASHAICISSTSSDAPLPWLS